MISKSQYEILVKYRNAILPDDSSNHKEFAEIATKYLDTVDVVENGQRYHRYTANAKGKAALEQFEQQVDDKRANRKISLAALFVAAGSLLVGVAALIVALVK